MPNRVTISACKHKRIDFQPYRSYCSILGEPNCSMICPHVEIQIAEITDNMVMEAEKYATKAYDFTSGGTVKPRMVTTW